MQVTVNNTAVQISDSQEKQPLSIGEFLSRLGYNTSTVAVALDGTHVPRHKWTETKIADGQCIDVVAPMQGG